MLFLDCPFIVSSSVQARFLIPDDWGAGVPFAPVRPMAVPAMRRRPIIAKRGPLVKKARRKIQGKNILHSFPIVNGAKIG
jgi:hypothetical protein